MAFRIKRKETAEEAVRRLSAELIDDALENLSHSGQPAAVHAVRKDIKKLRAVLRLVRVEIGEGNYREQTTALRKAARLLAAPRDAFVVSQVLNKLEDDFKDQIRERIPARALAGFKRNLQVKSREETRTFEDRAADNLGKVQRILVKPRDYLEKVSIPGKKTWSTICQGLEWSYSQGRKALQQVQKAPSDECFHEWRKRVKDLWYHVRILRPIWPEQMRATEKQLKTLGEMIGEDHDLMLLDNTIEAIRGRKRDQDVENLRAFIKTRKSELRNNALRLGGRLYVEKPAAFCRRLGDYWKLWRCEDR
jgi:CHAD domain-containing protein